MTKLEIWHAIQRQSPGMAAGMREGGHKEIARFIDTILKAFGEGAVVSIRVKERT